MSDEKKARVRSETTLRIDALRKRERARDTLNRAHAAREAAAARHDGKCVEAQRDLDAADAAVKAFGTEGN